MYVRGYDLFDRPVIYVKPRQESSRSEEHILRLFVYCLERAVACIEASQASSQIPRHGGQFVMIVCFDNYSPRSRPAIRTISRVLRILEDHYPQRLARAVLLRPPRMLAFFLKCSASIFGSETYEKVMVVHD